MPRKNKNEKIPSIPEEMLKNRALRALLRKTKYYRNNHPLIVSEETYTRVSAGRKFYPKASHHSNCSLVKLLTENRLLRPQRGKTFSYIMQPIDNLSFAQCASMLYNIPPKRILLSEAEFASEDFMQLPPRKRVQILYRAYNGAKWFEIFKQRLIHHRNVTRIPFWHAIRIQELPYLLGTGEYEPNDPRYNLNRLLEKGFIIPESREFIRKGGKNLVDNQALAQLVALSTNQRFDMVYDTDDEHLEDLIKDYVTNRLLPFMVKLGVNFEEPIQISAAEKMIGLGTGSVYHALQQGRAFHALSLNGKMAILGIDLAIYKLKVSDKYTYTLEEIAELFGANIDSEQLGLYGKPKKDYSRNQVFAIYDKFTGFVRQWTWNAVKKLYEPPEEKEEVLSDNRGQKITLDNDEDETIQVNRQTYTISRQGKISYCETYDLTHFDRSSMRHIIDNLSQSEIFGRTIRCPQIVFTTRKKDGKIYSANINRIKAPKAPKDTPIDDNMSDYDTHYGFTEEDKEVY